MDRVIVYPAAIPQDSDILQPQLTTMIALGNLMHAAFGTSTVADGLACTQTAIPGMHVTVAPGSIMTNLTVDSSSYGSLAADTSDALIKMGINITATDIGPFTAPVTAGQSQAHLIQAQLSETDAIPVVLQYYNASNSSIPYSGPANAGTPQNTQRIQRVLLQSKSGSPATTGSQVTPTPDAGFVGLYQITIANGATTILNANIVTLPTAPFADPTRLDRGIQPGRLLSVRTITTSGTYTPTQGAKSGIVEVQGGGGAGGGAAATGAGQCSAGAGGGAGGWARKYVASLTAQTVTIGAGGVGASNTAGTAGGTTSFGAIVTATGGSGGSLGPAASSAVAAVVGNGSGGAGASGDINAAGGHGSYAFYAVLPLGGQGGASHYGAGALYTSGTSAGTAAVTKGSGGSGGVIPASGGPAAGGAGAAGLVMVWEFT